MLSDKQRAFIFRPFDHCLDVAEGTPRSGKTLASTRRFALHLRGCRDINHLVVGYNQEQAFRLVIDGDGHGLQHYFKDSAIRHDDSGDYLQIFTANGERKVYFKGGGKADSHKSITGMSFGSIYFAEINLLHPDMVQECFRRTFAAKDRWHIADLNPPAPNHPVISDVFNVQDTYWLHWTIDDNPIITEERKKEIFQTVSKNPFLLRRDWYGERCLPQGVIYSMFDHARHIVDSIPKGERKLEMFFAGDGGLADATSIGCYVVTQAGTLQNPFYKLYRLANWYYSGTDTGRVKAMSVQAREIMGTFIPYCRQMSGIRESGIYIDPACKALRAELDLLGANTDKADNNGRDIKGSNKGIKVGIEYLQNAMNDGRFFIVENNKFGHADFLREISMYCVDDHGNPVDAYNHAMDETRYANNHFYKTYVV